MIHKKMQSQFLVHYLISCTFIFSNSFFLLLDKSFLHGKLAIGKHLMLSPAFPLLHTERASFQAFRVPSSDGFINYKFQVTLVELDYLISSNSHFPRYLSIFFNIGSVIPKTLMSVSILILSVIWISLCTSFWRIRKLLNLSLPPRCIGM
jgi:hypothetical protein